MTRNTAPVRRNRPPASHRCARRHPDPRARALRGTRRAPVRGHAPAAGPAGATRCFAGRVPARRHRGLRTSNVAYPGTAPGISGELARVGHGEVPAGRWLRRTSDPAAGGPARARPRRRVAAESPAMASVPGRSARPATARAVRSASRDWRRAPRLGGRLDRRCPAHGRRSGRPVRGSPCHGGAFACRVAGGPGAGTAGGRWPAAPGRSPASRPARSTPRLGVDYASSASTRAAQMKSLSESPPTSWVDHSTWQWP